jgi:hypothetical protein
MGFADAYLLKAGLREALIEPDPHPGLKISVCIPVYNESGLERCLDSLFQCTCGESSDDIAEAASSSRGDFHAEVLILINAPSEAPAEVLEQNHSTLKTASSWISKHSHPCLDFHVMLDHSFGRKEAGVGTARKILMDEAVRRFNFLENSGGIIACMDADALVQPNYLEALLKHFEHGTDPAPEGCSLRFEHPLVPETPTTSETFSPEVYDAIARYELHMRYYLQAVRFTGYPYAFHTVGSAFALQAGVYCMEGGMNRRQAGEDFYFIQKVAQRGQWSQCKSTCVIPSPRPSDRVPFGTGAMVRRLSREGETMLSYDLRPFAMLRELFQKVVVTSEIPDVLRSFLEEQEYEKALEEIRRNSGSEAAFRKRYWRWFNMFRIMKFLHHARERGYPDIPVELAATKMLRLLDPEGTGLPLLENNARKLLWVYRILN